jgi:tetratricopeptide (TPR) repeat protein
MKWLKGALTGVILAAAASAIRYVSYQPLRCNDVAMLVTGNTQHINQIADPSLLTVLTRENLEKLEPCRRDVPWNVNLHMLAGANYAARDQHEEAVRMYEDALRYDHRPEIYFNLGVELLKLGRTEESIEPLTIACGIKSSMVNEIPDPIRSQIIARVADHENGGALPLSPASRYSAAPPR